MLLLVFNNPQPLLPAVYLSCPTTCIVVLCLCPIHPSDTQCASTYLTLAGTGDNPHRTFLQLQWQLKAPAVACGVRARAADKAASHAHHKVATLGDCQVPTHLLLTARSDSNHNLVGTEVGAIEVLLRRHPHALAARGNGLRSAHIGEDDVTVEVVLVDVARRSIEVRTTAHHALPHLALTLLPNVHHLLVNASVEGNDGERGKRSQLVEFREERSQHLVTHRPRLVDGDSDIGKASHLATSMDTRVTLVDATDGRVLVSANGSLDEVTQHLTPIDVGLEPLHDLLATLGRHRAPIVRLGCFASGFLDNLLQTLLGHSLNVVGNIAPARVVVKGTAALTIGRVAATFGRVTSTVRRLALTLVTLLGLVLFLLLLVLLKPLKVVVGGHFRRVVLERALGRDARNLGDAVDNALQTVDSKVGSNVPHLRHALFGKAHTNVVKDEVVELMHENTNLLVVGERSHKLGIVEHFVLHRILIDTNASSRKSRGRHLVDVARDRGEERLRHKQSVHMQVKVEFHRGLRVSGGRDGGKVDGAGRHVYTIA
ncbi:MAG: hypothetical protein RIR47_61 [Bacteroidota bacterium]